MKVYKIVRNEMEDGLVSCHACFDNAVYYKQGTESKANSEHSRLFSFETYEDAVDWFFRGSPPVSNIEMEGFEIWEAEAEGVELDASLFLVTPWQQDIRSFINGGAGEYSMMEPPKGTVASRTLKLIKKYENERKNKQSSV